MGLLRIPGVRLAMSTAVTKRLRNWISVMCLSCGNVVSRGLPLPEGNMILVGPSQMYGVKTSTQDC
jgi:hypothetical protein